MRVTHVQLADFRSYGSLDLAIGPGVTTFVGRNGQGKTNLVEAVRYLSTLSSHRVAADAPLLRFGSERSVIGARIEKNGRALSMEVTLNSGKQNTARLNRGQIRPRELLGVLRTVVFAPEDLMLVKGDPAGRRQLMDELVVSLQPALAGDLADYDRVLKQRGSMLKTAKNARGDLTMLDIWDEKLAQLGARIIHARRRAVAALAPHVAEAYADVAPEGGLCELTYSTSLDSPAHRDADPVIPFPADATVAEIESRLLDRLRTLRSQEIERGVNLAGPHRDDLDITLGGMPAKGYASHGESWSCALALRLGTYTLLTADGGPDDDPDGEPVLILDDVFAELDSGRRAALARRLTDARQVLITAAVAEDVPAELAAHPAGAATVLVSRDESGLTTAVADAGGAG
ncbi:DNA replication/repair protein RecF [Demequina zhanjiangensis]|uniref:DNA replication and repair protein RecF n=1 Tax=Demequina zhanjiangensis TaxID=3051659 RepID=A0ABT8G416_9MICO|nr:DNA replication/repair protein RecF [Demequina sp. SYSU T00b26]MDN4473885.1 DNA replication/repair protein RecF [Demequina sp. SYSU T00b26]